MRHKAIFTLRPYRNGDQNSLQRTINHRLIHRTTSTIPYPYSLRDAEEWVETMLRLEQDPCPRDRHWAIDIGGDVVGGAGLVGIHGHKAEIGYWLTPSFWGQGIMTSAVRQITRVAFREMGLRRVFGRVFTFNPASRRVLEKCGYLYEGTLRKDLRKGARWMDVDILAKVT